jgi:hypothetical protein
MLSEAPDLGGAVDIDLFVIQFDASQPGRESERITDDIHLDIVYHTRDLYRNTRRLRLDPWLGPTIYGCMILHDPQHFIDFIQAGVRAQFDWPENVLGRARQRAEQARQDWLRFQSHPPANDPAGVSAYLETVECAANAIALLTGASLTERRFLPQFAARAATLGRGGLLAGLLGLIGGAYASPEVLHAWLPEWRQAFAGLQPGRTPERLHPQRLNYYIRAFEHYLASETTAQMALWPMLRTWTDMALNSTSVEAWQAAIQQLGWTGEGFAERLEALDAFLDTVDETLERWGAEHGAS